jgi:hypothetical protein
MSDRHEVYEARTPEDVAQRLRSLGALGGTVAIDGKDGVGKSWLASWLASARGGALGGTVIALDDFVEPNRGGYVPYLRRTKLKRALEEAAAPRIVEGICVLDALEQVCHRPDALIYVKLYVKLVDDIWYWPDECKRICDPSEPIDDLIAEEKARNAEVDRLFPEQAGRPPSKKTKKKTTPGLDPLREEVIRYHAAYRPLHRAHIVWLNCPPSEGAAP